MLAKVVNDDVGTLEERGVLAFFASKLAPTGGLPPIREFVSKLDENSFIHHIDS